MIFRGDGKNNMNEGSCFNQHLIPHTVKDPTLKREIQTAKFSHESSDVKVITKVLMNPPFALKVDSEKEYKFVQYALEEMDMGGILFAILPISTMVEKAAYYWRKSLINDNTLLAVISFPNDLFYPIAENTVGIFIKRGKSPESSKNVLWCRAVNDGFLKKKGKRLFHPEAENDFTLIKPFVRSFISNQHMPINDIPQILKVCPVDMEDNELELAPEAYIDDRIYTELEIMEGMNKLYKENLAFKVRYGEQYDS